MSAGWYTLSRNTSLKECPLKSQLLFCTARNEIKPCKTIDFNLKPELVRRVFSLKPKMMDLVLVEAYRGYNYLINLTTDPVHVLPFRMSKDETVDNDEIIKVAVCDDGHLIYVISRHSWVVFTEGLTLLGGGCGMPIEVTAQGRISNSDLVVTDGDEIYTARMQKSNPQFVIKAELPPGFPEHYTQIVKESRQFYLARMPEEIEPEGVTTPESHVKPYLLHLDYLDQKSLHISFPNTTMKCSLNFGGSLVKDFRVLEDFSRQTTQNSVGYVVDDRKLHVVLAVGEVGLVYVCLKFPLKSNEECIVEIDGVKEQPKNTLTKHSDMEVRMINMEKWVFNCSVRVDNILWGGIVEEDEAERHIQVYSIDSFGNRTVLSLTGLKLKLLEKPELVDVLTLTNNEYYLWGKSLPILKFADYEKQPCTLGKVIKNSHSCISEPLIIETRNRFKGPFTQIVDMQLVRLQGDFTKDLLFLTHLDKTISVWRSYKNKIFLKKVLAFDSFAPNKELTTLVQSLHKIVMDPSSHTLYFYNLRICEECIELLVYNLAPLVLEKEHGGKSASTISKEINKELYQRHLVSRGTIYLSMFPFDPKDQFFFDFDVLHNILVIAAGNKYSLYMVEDLEQLAQENLSDVANKGAVKRLPLILIKSSIVDNAVKFVRFKNMRLYILDEHYSMIVFTLSVNM